MTSPSTSVTLPLFDLTRQWPRMQDEALALVANIGSRGAFSLGGELSAFEGAFAEACSTADCVGTSSGTSAIELALRALGVGPGDEVITPAMTFIATVEAIARTGATPVFADIDAIRRCLAPDAIRDALSPRTRAVVVVHLYGMPADIPAIRRLTDEAGVALVEDCAQAHGARLDDQPVGSFGAAGAFSFYPTKPLGAFGDGGAVTTSRPDVAAGVRSLRHHGSAPDDANLHLLREGGTERLDNLQAALLHLKLRWMDADSAERRDAADRYRGLLDGLPLVAPPVDPAGAESVHHLFVVELDARDAVRAELDAAGVKTGIHYPTPAHLQPAWAELGAGPGSLPATEALASRALSLPIFAGITQDEQARVADALRTALQNA